MASTLFVSAVTIAVGALFSAQATFTRIQAVTTSMDSANAVMEVMTRSLRYGSEIYCGATVMDALKNYRQSCSASGNVAIVFKPADAVLSDDRVGFYVSNNKIYEYQHLSGVDVTPDIVLTSDDLQVSVLRFYVSGSNTSAEAVSAGSLENSDPTTDYDQPKVTVLVGGKTISTRSNIPPVSFALQSAVSLRSIDY